MGKIERVNITSVQELYNLVSDRSVRGFFGAITCSGEDTSGEDNSATFYNGYLSWDNLYEMTIHGPASTGVDYLYLDRRESTHEASGYIYIYS